MKKQRTYQCDSCGAQKIHEKKGRLPKTCGDCQEQHPIDNHDGKRRQAIKRLQGKGLASHTLAIDEMLPARVAVGLSLFPDDPVRACNVVGLATSLAEAKMLAEVAKAKFSDLIEAKPSSVLPLMNRAAALYAIRLIETADLQSPRDLPNALRSFATFNELVAGDARAAYGNIVINVPATVPDRKPPEGS